MRNREKTALAFTPLVLRVLLAATFIWAGVGKILGEVQVSGQQAALLANMGVATSGTARQTPAPSQLAPTEPLRPTGGDARITPANDARIILTNFTQQDQQRIYTAADFSKPVSVQAVHKITLLVHAAASPGWASTGERQMRLLPEELSKDQWPVRLAWAAALTEFFGGLFLFFGFLTRLSAFSIFWVMATAIWLTTIGPGLQTQADPGTPGFFQGRDLMDISQWVMQMWQLSLLSSCLALVFAGPGALSLDSAVFRSGSRGNGGD